MTVPANHAEVTMTYSIDGSTHIAQNVIGVWNGTDLDAEQVASRFAIDWIETMIPLQTALVELNKVRAVLDNDSVFEVILSEEGTLAGDALPPNVTYLFAKKTATVGRANQGRFYLCGAAEAKVDMAGNIENTFLTTMQDAGDSLMDKLSADDIPMTIFHANDDPPIYVQTLQADPRVATQRRRLR